MASELEQLEIEIKRTQLQREQLALRDDLKKRERTERVIGAAQSAGAVGAQAVEVVAGKAGRLGGRALLFLIYWAFNAAILYFLLVGNDPAKVGGSTDFRMEHYFFWAISAGLALALVEYPWKNGGAIIRRKLFGK